MTLWTWSDLPAVGRYIGSLCIGPALEGDTERWLMLVFAGREASEWEMCNNLVVGEVVRDHSKCDKTGRPWDAVY